MKESNGGKNLISGKNNNITIHPSLCCAAPLVILSQHNPAAASSHASALFPGPKFYFRSCYVTSGEVGGEKNNRYCRREKEVLFVLSPDRQDGFWCPCLPHGVCESWKGQSKATALPESRPAAPNTNRISPRTERRWTGASPSALRRPPQSPSVLRSSVISLNTSNIQAACSLRRSFISC